MSKKIHVTFGQVHAHSVNGRTFDKDCVAVISCESEKEGRAKAFEYFGQQFCFTYFDTDWSDDKLAYFPRGLMEVLT